jgi:hypothetical protein
VWEEGGVVPLLFCVVGCWVIEWGGVVVVVVVVMVVVVVVIVVVVVVGWEEKHCDLRSGIMLFVWLFVWLFIYQPG